MTEPVRRYPNPWVAVPVLAATAIGWFIGARVARVTCQAASCTGDEIVWGLVGAVVGFVGVLVVSILVVRSLAEWAELSEEQRRPRQPQGPPTC